MTCDRVDHRIEDFWPETVVVCVCGWRTAEATMKCAVDAWKQHACCCPSGSYDRSNVHEDYCLAGTKVKVRLSR